MHRALPGSIPALFSLSLLSLMAGAPVAYADVAAYLGKPVTAVRLTLEGRDTADPSLSDVLVTKAGRPLSMIEVRESVTHLYSLGRFEDVLVDATGDGAGVALRYELQPVHPVTKIEFDGGRGVPGINEGALRRAVTDRYGASPPLGRRDEIARLVQDALRQSGYLRAAVTQRPILQHAPERATLVFSITPGSRTRIGTIDIIGAPSVPPAELQSQLQLTTGAPFEREALDARINRYIEGRRRHGYYEAKLVAAVRLADEDRVANITLTATPGPHMRVVFTGDPLPGDARDELVPVEREGSVDEDLLEDSSNRIEDYLRGLGYRNAKAPHSRDASAGELLITFDVKKGAQYRVQRLEITGNASMGLTEFESALRLRAGEPFSDAKLEADIATIEGLYRRRGFANARAEAGIDPVSPQAALQLVVVRIAVREGVRTLVGSIRIEGNQSIPTSALQEPLGSRSGEPFSAAQLAADRDTLEAQCADLGYGNATVDARPTFSADSTRADVVFSVHEGPRVFVDHILIVGNVRTSAKTILRAVQLKPGDPFGAAAINDAQVRLAALGLFRRARITALTHGNETARDLLVTVEEAPPTTIAYGGGGELRARVVNAEGGIASERIEFAPRASFQIGRRNLFGKNRSVDLFTSASLHPKDSAVFAGRTVSTSDTSYGFAEYRVTGTFREPRLFDTAADAYLTATMEQQIRSSFDFARRSASAAIARRLTRNTSITGNYQIQNTRLFNQRIAPSDQLDIDRVFPQVRLSSFSASLIRDTRNDPVDARTGTYFSANGQVAGRRIGSEVGFAKSFFTAQLFEPVPHAGGVVLAGQARFGLAGGFPRELTKTTADGQTIVETVEDLPLSERFFAGGDTTVRGYALDRLGVHNNPPQSSDTIDKDGFPLGGNALLLLNAELRAPFRWGLTGVGFLDAGNVFAHASDIDLGEIRGAIGFGVRWKSPLGPFRFDWGFKLRRDDLVPGRSEFWISFGQAF